MVSLAGKHCLITGGSRGLGRALGVAFARAGARVAFTYSRKDDDAQATAAAISAVGEAPLLFKGSVDDSKHVRAVVADLVTRWGRIDVLVNNAAVNQMFPLPLLEEEDWDHVLDVNLKGAYLFSRACARHMIKQKKGHILSMGSFASERIVESPLHYAASKSGLRGFTEALALEVGRHGILVNLLAPGIMTEGMSNNVPMRRSREYTGQSALGRLGRMEELAGLAAFMVSDDNTFMTGAKLSCDGGL